MEHGIPERNPLPGGRLDARVHRSQEGLRNALLELLVEKAFDDITIRDIAADANVGYTTFFRHYSSKEELLDAVIVTEIRQLTARARPIYDSADAFSACLALCEYVDQRRALWSALLTGGAGAKVREEMLAQSIQSSADYEVTDTLPRELGVTLSVAVLFEILSWWLRQATPSSVEEIARILQKRMIPDS